MNKNERADEVIALVKSWLAGEYTMFDACVEEPEIAWQAIVKISRYELTDEQKCLLGAGPLETLLAWHGPAFIERIVDEAKLRSEFNHLLEMVWHRGKSAEIREQIEQARKMKES